jgi:hypothetical protein
MKVVFFSAKLLFTVETFVVKYRFPLSASFYYIPSNVLFQLIHLHSVDLSAQIECSFSGFIL